jgi:hypothetical protein
LNWRHFTHYKDSTKAPTKGFPHSPNVAASTSLQVILSAMLIDLNTLAHEGDGEPLPDLNAAPTSISLQSIPSSAILLDVNIVLGEGSEEPLPDLNQELADDGGDEIQYLQGDQFHLNNEAEVHPLIGQSHYLQKEQDGAVHVIDLNIATSEGQEEEAHEGNFSLNVMNKSK